MPGGPEYAVIGGGPAGVAAGYTLARAGFRVAIYDSAPRLGLKPCGKGIPRVEDLPFPIPREVVVREIHGATLYVDGERVFDADVGLSGVIVDKGAMLEALAAEAGVELVLRAYYKPGDGYVRVGGSHVKVERGLFAGGHAYYSGEKINAYQYRVKSHSFEGLNKLIIYFDTRLLGYYYIFPGHGDEADVGVGGYAGFPELKSRLDKFLESNEYIEKSTVLKGEGAQIAVGGVEVKRIGGLPAIGESAGFVLPLTGEGIRPGIVSGYTAARALIEEASVEDRLKKSRMTASVDMQRRILVKVKEMPPHRRGELLKSIPPSVHAMVALGDIDKVELAKALIGKPHLLARILKAL